MAEQIVRDFLAAEPTMSAVIFRYFNVYGSDPAGRLGEYPRPELRQHSRISGACIDAALREIDQLTITGAPPLLVNYNVESCMVYTSSDAMAYSSAGCCMHVSSIEHALCSEWQCSTAMQAPSILHAMARACETTSTSLI